MAVVVTTALDARRLDNVFMTISGVFNTTVTSTDLRVITPSNELINVDLAPENFAVPIILPITRSISANLLGLQTYEDGVYEFTYTVNYDDDTIEIATASVLLFDSNATAAWFDLMERHLALGVVCGDDPETRKRQEAKEILDAAEEAFSLFRYDDANRLLDAALNIINSCS